MAVILIVDDAHERHRHLKRILRGHETHSAFSLHGTMQLLTERLYDMAFLDHDLGVAVPDGKEVARALTKLEVHVRPSQIVIHSWNREGALEMGKILHDAGFTQVLIAPFDMDKFSTMFR